MEDCVNTFKKGRHADLVADISDEKRSLAVLTVLLLKKKHLAFIIVNAQHLIQRVVLCELPDQFSTHCAAGSGDGRRVG